MIDSEAKFYADAISRNNNIWDVTVQRINFVRVPEATYRE